jgi:hypothetical protein
MAVPTVGETPAVKPLSTHTSDSSLQPFMQPSFDPAEYLNQTLPILSTSSQASTTRSTASTGGASLTDLSAQTQSLLSQLNARLGLLTAVLTQLTDDILRSGARLAYEVEVLRGEAIGLSEILNDGIRDDAALFGKLDNSATTHLESQDASSGNTKITSGEADVVQDPAYITQLRTFSQVRQRLDSVVKVFGEAMQWTLPPSEVSLTSSFISVSGPEPGSDSNSREEKGREFAARLRTEIADLIMGAESKEQGYNAATDRIAALNDLAHVWKGTAEEKARVRFVENLAKLAEERVRELERDHDGARFRDTRTASPRKGGASNSRSAQSEKGTGFLDNLYRMRNSTS